MNERINAYLKQHHCRDYFNSYGETVEDDHYFMYQEDVDGLIELIVRECIDKIETYRIPVGNSASGELACEWTYDALKEIRDDIKETFGVE